MMSAETQFDANELESLTKELQSLAEEISDEALEDAACSGPHCGKSFTVTMCTGQAECPF
jgi:hypothetical protein